MVMEEASAECVVIGAGFSGLTAATKLSEAGIETLVLEARERVGGRAHSIALDDGTVIDLGGQWIGAVHHRLLQLAEKHGAPAFVQRTEGAKIVHAGGRRIRFRGDIPFRLGPIVLGSMAVAMLRLVLMARTLPAGRPWMAPRAREWDGQTFESWLSRHVWTEKARSLLRSMFAGLFAADPADLSLLHALSNLNMDESARNLTEAIHAGQYKCLRDGMQHLAEQMAKPLGEGVRLGQAVRRIRHGDAGVQIETDAMRVRAERVIVAIPPTLAGRIAYDPPLPGARDQLTQRMPQGSAIKCIAVYERPFWRESGDSGLTLDDQGPVSFTIDATPDPGGCGILIGFIGGANARRIARSSAEERREQVIASLVRSLGPAAASPRDYRDVNWSEEPFTRGCYGAAMPPGAWTNYGEALREPVGRIHWAGAETAREWSGNFEGAIEAGERAAGEVLAALG